MEKLDKLKKRLQMFLVMIFLLPCIFIYGCSCSPDNTDDDSTNKDIICTVHFYTGIAAEFNIPSQEVQYGKTVTKPRMDSRYIKGNTIYQFIGWYTDQTRSDESVWLFDNKVYSDMTLYAHWEIVE